MSKNNQPPGPNAGSQDGTPPTPPPRKALLDEFFDVAPVFALLPAAVAGYMLHGAVGSYGEGDGKRIIDYDKLRDFEAGAWSGDQYANLGWVGIVLVLVLLFVGVKRERTGTLSVLGLTGQLLFGVAVATFSIAWAEGRQNYWDAYHFSVLAWTAFTAASTAFVASMLASRRGSVIAPAFQATAGVCVALSALVWLYTWNPWLQQFEGWVARTLWLATHG